MGLFRFHTLLRAAFCMASEGTSTGSLAVLAVCTPHAPACICRSVQSDWSCSYAAPASCDYLLLPVHGHTKYTSLSRIHHIFLPPIRKSLSLSRSDTHPHTHFFFPFTPTSFPSLVFRSFPRDHPAQQSNELLFTKVCNWYFKRQHRDSFYVAPYYHFNILSTRLTEATQPYTSRESTFKVFRIHCIPCMHFL